MRCFMCQDDSVGTLACKDQQDTWAVIGINRFVVGFCQQSVVSYRMHNLLHDNEQLN